MFFNLTIVFAIGAILGWFIEIFWRSLVSDPKINLNPGFLKGPYVPLYGFGLVLLYLLSFLDLNLIVKIFISGIILTIIELVGSLLLKKVFNKKLWDYSNYPFNFRGHICLTYFFFWTILSALFYLELINILNLILFNFTTILIPILIIFYIIIILDFSIKLIQL